MRIHDFEEGERNLSRMVKDFFTAQCEKQTEAEL